MNKEINEIIRLCLALDKKAFEIYGKLAETGENDELNQFWNTMCDEEHNHVEFWERLQKFAQEGMIPQVFDNAWQIIKELKDLIEKVDTLFVKSKKPMSTSNSLLLAYKLEFYLLHPALGTLFNFVRLFDDHKNPADEYDHHISMFLEALNKYGSKTPEIEYLAEAL
ncbi:MAG: hypothetical protein HY758_09030, partial [Nitrospirae bacterium]|nr:hypothetical protein [Nitrospirota bacterium]